MSSVDSLSSRKKFFRLANYLGAAQLYLRENYFLHEPLLPEHIKDRILGHWGTVPGINFVYLYLNHIAKKYSQHTLLVTGPGHGYPALLANLYIEGTLGDYYPDYTHGHAGMGKLIHDFSWPGGFPSHANPETPGAILEGGELGYALSTAYGAAFDNPDLLSVALIGDGEAETGPLSAAWQSNKFLNPVSDGAVLPIVHINQYKISGPTLFASMSEQELESYFIGLGYEPIFMYTNRDDEDPFVTMEACVEQAYSHIRDIQTRARSGEEICKPRWPAILLISKKGWTCTPELNGNMIEDSFRSHGIPLEKVKHNDVEFNALKTWLESYHVQELLDSDGVPISEILELLPQDAYKIGKVPCSNGGQMRIPLQLPRNEDLSVKFDTNGRCLTLKSNTAELGRYLSSVVTLNPENFRVMCPDETESNKLQALFEVTNRCFMWPVPKGSENIARDGRVMEILSEHTLQGWMEGYILTGRHSIFITYEAFAMIIASMVDQYNKFLIQSEAIAWRKPIPSMNFVLTSTSWRQDHNGFSHQNPGFVSSQLNNNSQHVRVYYPLDVNMMLVTLEHALSATNRINIIIAGKRDLPQYITLDEAQKAFRYGLLHLPWAGNHPDTADVTFVATGDYAAQEIFATMQILRETIPQLHTRCVYVSQLSCLHFADENSGSHDTERFCEVFGRSTPIIYAYHGYVADLQQLLFNHSEAHRFQFHGYMEQGTTTTPFDMLVKNKSSRYDLALSALRNIGSQRPDLTESIDHVVEVFEQILEDHRHHIREYGQDLDIVRNFKLAL